MFIRMLGVVLVIGGFGFYGLSRASAGDRRVAQLTGLRLSLNFMEKEISCMHTPLPRALARTANFTAWPVNCLYQETADRLQNRNLTAAEAWSYGVNKLNASSNLNGEDIELLRSAAMQLGRSDITEQHKFLFLMQEELAVQEEKARREAASAHKIWTYGGFIVGAMIVLLLI